MLTFLLAKVFGTYMIIGGIAILARKRFFASVVGALIEERAARIALSALDILFGLFIVNLHPFWGPLPVTLVTLIGWGALLKGILGFFLSDASLEKFGKTFRDKKLYMIEAVIIIIIGIYLAGFGFGWFY